MQFPADFPLSKPCGEIMCPNFYFCLAHDHQCHHCYSFCNEMENNYDQDICERDCPEYNTDFLGHVINKRSTFIGSVEDDFHVENSGPQFEVVMGLGVVMAIFFMFIMCLIYKYWSKCSKKNKWTILETVEEHEKEVDGKTFKINEII